MPSMQDRNNSGFTLIEMLIIAPVVILAIGGFIATIIYMTGDAVATRAQNTMAYDVQDALDRIEQDVRLSGAFLAQSNLASITAPQGSSDDTQRFQSVDTGGSRLILNAFATSENPSSASRTPIYLINSPHACTSSDIAQNQVMTFNIVYFIKETDGVSSLWRRTMMPSNYTSAGCSGQVPWQQPSCSEGATATFCRTTDVRVLDDITYAGLQIRYYNSAQTTTENTNASSQNLSTRQSALTNVDTIQITLSPSAVAGGRDISHSGTLRATRIGAYNDRVTPLP